MNEQISDIERRILAVIQQGFPRSRRPYEQIAEQVGVETEELLAILKNWRQSGKVRRIGAIVNHFKIGLGTGAMVVWQVESARVLDVGRILAGFEEVSHAYERKTSKNWPFNLYTMVHGRSRQEVKNTVEKMSRQCGVCDYRLLFTEKELKKTAPVYVSQPENKIVEN